MHTDDKKTRRLAFVVITIVFIASVAALLYWAINDTAARINSKITVHCYYYSLLISLMGSQVGLEGKAAILNS